MDRELWGSQTKEMVLQGVMKKFAAERLKDLHREACGV